MERARKHHFQALSLRICGTERRVQTVGRRALARDAPTLAAISVARAAKAISASIVMAQGAPICADAAGNGRCGEQGRHRGHRRLDEGVGGLDLEARVSLGAVREDRGMPPVRCPPSKASAVERGRASG